MHCNRFHSHTLLLCNKQIWASWILERSSRAHLSISTSQILSAMSWHRYIPAHRRKGMAPTLHLLLSHPPTHPCLLCGGLTMSCSMRHLSLLGLRSLVHTHLSIGLLPLALLPLGVDVKMCSIPRSNTGNFQAVKLCLLLFGLLF